MNSPRSGFLFAITAILFAPVFSQNQAPVVQIQEVILDESTGTLTLDYDLSDQEGDLCEVRILFSEDQGSTFSTFPFSISGETGAGIAPGTDKLVTLYPVLADDSLIQVKVVAFDQATPDLISLVDQVDSTSVKSFLELIAVERNHLTALSGIEMIRDSLDRFFLSEGLQTSKESVQFGSYTGANVRGDLPGLTEGSEFVILDAHFDAVPGTPGANDNGVATAALMEAVKVLSNGYYRRSVRFLAFDLEEYGLLGSIAHVQQIDPNSETLLGMLNLEMIGYFTEVPNTQAVPVGFNLLFPGVYAALQADSFRGNFLANVGNTTSIPLQNTFDSLASVYAPQLIIYNLALPGNGTIAPDFRRSDHAPFWDAGYQALMLTAGADFRDTAYHSSSDSLNRIHFTKVEEVLRSSVATIAHLAGPLNAGEDVSGVQNNTSVSKKLSQDNIRLFPNPGNEYLHMQAERPLGQWQVYSRDGRMIDSGETTANELDLQTRDWASGTYYIYVTAPEGFWAASWIRE